MGRFIIQKIVYIVDCLQVETVVESLDKSFNTVLSPFFFVAAYKELLGM